MTPRPHPRITVAAGILSSLLVLVLASTIGAHDLFLRAENYFVRPASDVRLFVLNGTFSTSENGVTADRLRGLHLAGPSGISAIDTSRWRAVGDTSRLSVHVGDAGTYVVGASLAPRELRLEAKEFNEYLRTDGIPDVLAARRAKGELTRAARERYHKHPKAVLQVGDTPSPGFDRILGYPAELVPLDNPYAARAGGTVRVRALVDGKPVANQLLLAGGRTPSGARIPQRATRTDSAGVARVRVTGAGVWYVKFIHMTPATGDTTIDYESKWATLTFAIRR